MSVVSVASLPAGHPVLLGGQGAPWRWVALLLPDPHPVVLGHDPVIAGPLKEVTLEKGRRERPLASSFCASGKMCPAPSFPTRRSSKPGPLPKHNAISLR